MYNIKDVMLSESGAAAIGAGSRFLNLCTPNLANRATELMAGQAPVRGGGSRRCRTTTWTISNRLRRLPGEWR